MLRHLILAPLLALALAVSLSTPAMADMTRREAKDTYLAAICPTNVASERLYRVLFRGKAVFYATDIKGERLKRVRAALRQVEQADFRGARRLLNPPDAWPTNNIQRAVGRVADALLDEIDVAMRLRGRQGQGFVNMWNNQFNPATKQPSNQASVARLADCSS
jgi:hypothetical protein